MNRSLEVMEAVADVRERDASPARRSLSKRWLVLIIAVLVVAVAAGYYLLTRGSSAPAPARAATSKIQVVKPASPQGAARSSNSLVPVQSYFTGNNPFVAKITQSSPPSGG